MLAVLVLVFQAVSCGLAETDAGAESLFKIEGKIVIQGAKIEEWSHQTRILVNGGEFVGFVRSDGMFTVSNVPPGSHLVEVSSPNYMFEMARVEISSKSKGKMRARKVDNVQPSKVDAIPYPLRLKTKGRAEYFEKREEWRLKDALANPMVSWSRDSHWLARLSWIFSSLVDADDGTAVDSSCRSSTPYK